MNAALPGHLLFIILHFVLFNILMLLGLVRHCDNLVGEDGCILHIST